jgi:hypothetical protein
MEKRRFVHEFALLFLLALAVGAIFMQSNFNFTGYAVLGEFTNQTSCESAGHFWYNDACNSEAQPICDASHLSLCLDEPTCTTATGFWYNSLCNSEAQPICDASHLSLCLDETTCESASGFWYNEVCNDACTESWECQAWSECSGGTKTRTCTDANSCGTEADIPSLTHDCTETTTTTAATDASDASSTEILTSTCSPNWECGAWQECIESVQVRACTDLNNCGTQEGMPSTSQACTSEVLENCADGIQNQDEKGIDCGGSCSKKCGNFFTIVGSAITGQISAVFANKTNIFIFVGVLALAVLGFLGFKFFSKHAIKITSKN